MAEIAEQPMYAGGPMTAADWTAANPLLSKNQIGLEKDPATGAITKAKLGNGVDRWNDLAYFDPVGLSTVPTATAINPDTDTVPVIQDGETKQGTIADVVNSVGGGGTTLVELFTANATTYPVGFADDDRVYHESKALVATGGGSPSARGEMSMRGFQSGKQAFYGLDVPFQSDGLSISWNGTQWTWVDSDANPAYVSTDDVATPDLATFTTGEETTGVLPAPSLELVDRAYASTIAELRARLFDGPTLAGTTTTHVLRADTLAVNNALRVSGGELPRFKVSTAPLFDADDEGQNGSFFVVNVGGTYHLKFQYKVNSGTPIEIDLGALA